MCATPSVPQGPYERDSARPMKSISKVSSKTRAHYSVGFIMTSDYDERVTLYKP